jgi:uncharacterized protein involved in exopolysaccharide biosynthesis
MVEYSEVNIFDYFRVIKKRRWLIATVTTVAILLASIITSATPEQYVATAVLLQPVGRRAGSGAGLAYLSQVLSASAYNPSEFERPYQELLQTQLLAKKVAKILGRSSTAGISVYRLSGRSVFNISCKSSDRKLAALMANAYVQALYEYEQDLAQKALDQRISYINMQLKKQEENLSKAEQALIQFQRENQTLSVDGEVSVAVQAIARIKYEIIEQEAELNNALRYYSENHPDMVQLRNNVETKKAKLQEEIEKALSPSPAKSKAGGAVMSNMLEKAAQFARLQKMVEVHRAIARTMVEESEKLKLEKAKIYKPFEVVDPAVPARFPSIPNVKFNLFLGFILGFVAGLSLSFFLEYLEVLQKKETAVV